MKRELFSLVLLLAFALHAIGGEVSLPDQPMQEQLAWAQTADTPKERAARLHAFWVQYLPQEDGGTNANRIGYEDGSHVCAVVECAWQLTRAYIGAGETRKALAMMDWLAEHESRTGLAPFESAKPNKREQPAGSDPAPDH